MIRCCHLIFTFLKITIKFMNSFKDNIDIWVVNQKRIEMDGEKQILYTILKQYNIKIKNFGHYKTGKPYLKGQGIEISISRSGEISAFAFCFQDEIGLDIEKVRPLDDMENFSNYIFVEKYVKNIMYFQGLAQSCAFFKYWTLYEAYAKLSGKGLADVLNNKKRLEFDIDNNFIYTFKIEKKYIGTIICSKKKRVKIIKF